MTLTVVTGGQWGGNWVSRSIEFDSSWGRGRVDVDAIAFWELILLAVEVGALERWKLSSSSSDGPPLPKREQQSHSFSKEEDCTLPHLLRRKLPESRNVLVWQGPNWHIYSGRSPAESTGNQHIPAESVESIWTFSAEQVHWTPAESNGITRLRRNPVDSSRAYL